MNQLRVRYKIIRPSDMPRMKKKIAVVSVALGERIFCWMNWRPPEKGVTFLFSQSLPERESK